MVINHLDLFSGIGGFHLGFERAGYKVNAFFSEVDQHAIAVYKHKFPNSTYVGSVTDVHGGDLPRIDLITFGSPCQDFSLAGKRKGMSGERSSLVSEAIRLIDECRPRVFVWENVKGTFSSNAGEDFAAIIQAFTDLGGYTLEWQLLNTAWFLPQNRERIYLVGYLGRPRHYTGSVFPITEAGRKDISLEGTRAAVSKTLTARGQHDLHSGLQLVEVKYPSDVRGKDTMPTVRTGGRSSITAKHSWDIVIESGPHEVKQLNKLNESNNGTQPYMQNRVYDGDGIAPAVTQFANQMKVVEPMIYDGYNGNIKKDNIVGTITQHCSRFGMTNGFKVLEPTYTYEAANKIVRENEFYEGEPKALDFYNHSVRDDSPTLTDPKHNNQGLFDGYRIRRLTPIECERLQGFPDNHTKYGIVDGEVKEMANTHRYKQCGNAVTVDVVEAVAKQIKKNLLL
jgi:DNA (cytosine-5)-methyltransferase 1